MELLEVESEKWDIFCAELKRNCMLFGKEGSYLTLLYEKGGYKSVLQSDGQSH